MSLLARNSSKCRRICFEVRLNLKIICLYKYLLYTVHILYIICYINMQCTIMLESNSMFYHFSSDSTVCTSCLPSLSIDRCKSTRFPVVGQNHIQNVRFLSTKKWASCLFLWLLATFLYWIELMFWEVTPTPYIHVMTNYDWHIWQPCLTKPIWFVWEGTACSGSRSSSWLPSILLQRLKIWKSVPWRNSVSVGFLVEAYDRPMSFEAAGLNIMHHVDLFMGWQCR